MYSKKERTSLSVSLSWSKPETKDSERSVFNFHVNPNPKCPVGSKIHAVLDQPLDNAQKALEEELKKTTIKDLMGKL